MDWSVRYRVSRSLMLQFAPDGQLYAGSTLSRDPRKMAIDAIPVVSAFAPPRTVAEAFERLTADYDFERDGFEVVVGELIASNALTPADEADHYVPGDVGFASLHSHLAMLRDLRRVQTYQVAIERAARGKTVLEIGCGTGILSTIAAKAGARKVYAIEETTIADVAHEVFAANGVADRVELVRGNSMDVELPERCDLLIHEIIGTEPIGENLLPVIDDARARLLAPAAQLLPFRLDLCLVGVESTRSDDFTEVELAIGELSKVYGVALDPFADRLRAYHAGRPIPQPSEPLSTSQMVTAETTFASIDLREPWEPQLLGARDVVVEATRVGRLAGVALLFRAHLDDRTVLGNQPWLAATSWGYAWKGFRREAARTVAPGDRITLDIAVDRTVRDMMINVSPRPA